MQRQRTRDTAPELAVRRLLHRSGLRYRVDTAPLRGLRRRADVVFRPARVAVFIDGCFWHGCPEHASRTTKTHPGYWAEKIGRNRARDEDTDAVLGVAGWKVLRFWEHEDPASIAAAVTQAVHARRPRPPNASDPRAKLGELRRAPSSAAVATETDSRL